jgi:hypothetical protein
VDGANYDDVARDKDSTRREVTLTKLGKFQNFEACRFLTMPSSLLASV